MGTKTIGIREEVYERLKARKREGESFTDVVDRLIEESATDWRTGFGTLQEDDAAELERVAERSRRETGAGVADRQDDAIEALAEVEDDDETA
ncbi:antitoxin VapB family protein (plasmid) [Halorientalis pallida]|uniref:antitoxin VapB family protein n=1 Tax=Halorientalis pallida TaxID=2479928 RepID=UPI003C6FABA4